jgi:hypothetical protein
VDGDAWRAAASATLASGSSDAGFTVVKCSPLNGAAKLDYPPCALASTNPRAANLPRWPSARPAEILTVYAVGRDTNNRGG